ncbi:hypothetical protein [Niastella sp. OAS944]|uniref:hypothetical protein n=1 Tax=Niastella sp. OAS944 TaxID=2664089 RepID=UPI003478AC7A|nr:hypothetical protein [Chitinophagaceae bacterium OAS944]
MFRLNNLLKQLVPVILTALVLSCKNKYEKAVTGNYEVYEYKNKDTASASPLLVGSKLTLNEDNTFLFVIDKKQLNGKWNAGDDGDRTWIRFEFNSITSDGVIGGDSFNIIEIVNPQDFGCPSLESLSYKRLIE